MSVSMYDLSLPALLHSLGNLKSVLQKGVAFAEAKKIEPSVLLQSRLYPDMLPLTRQVQIATDMAKGAAARLTGVDPPKYEDNETTVAELFARIDKTIDYLRSFKPEQFAAAETRSVTINTRNGPFTFSGVNYLRHWALPNFYFHVTTAYGILRHNGVEIGKADYLGKLQD